MTDIELMESVCPWTWAFVNVKVNGRPFKRERHEYLMDFMMDKSPIKTVMKATQAGYTLGTIITILHMLIFSDIQANPIQGILYLFPNQSEVYKFSQSRFAPMINENPVIRKHISKKDVQNAMLKRIGKANLFFAGGNLPQDIQGGLSRESASLRSMPIDMTVFDEKDLMHEDIEEAARGRMSHSEFRYKINLSNPTIPEASIDRDFQKSDQRYWGYSCECGEITLPMLEFIDGDIYKCLKPDSDGKGKFFCKKCGRVLRWENGLWKAQKAYDGHAGWLWSHFENTYDDPWQLMMEYEQLEDGLKKTYFMNQQLGLPYMPLEDRLTVDDVLLCCGQDGLSQYDNGPCAMGVDIGDKLHIVVGKVIGGRKKHKIIWAGECRNFNELHDTAKRFGVEAAVMDVQPEIHSFREFQKSEPYIVFGCRYLDNPKGGTKMDSDSGIIGQDRTEIFDESRNLFIHQRVELPRRGPTMQEYARQVCNIQRVRMEQSDSKKASSGKEWVYKYRKRKPDDHYRSATNYFMLACNYVRQANIEQVYFRDRSDERANEYTKEIAFR